LVAAPLRGLSYEPLRTAINRGNKDAAIDFLSLNEDAKTARISKDGGTVLHVAVFAGRTEIVEKLVELMSMEELEIKDENGCTALLWAAVQQINTGMIDCMLRKNSNLLDIPDHSNRIPLIAALEYGNIEVARSLYSASLRYDQRLSDIHTSTVLSLFIDKNHFGKDARSNYFIFF
jgi:ankyrin repeat protein